MSKVYFFALLSLSLKKIKGRGRGEKEEGEWGIGKTVHNSSSEIPNKHEKSHPQWSEPNSCK